MADRAYLKHKIRERRELYRNVTNDAIQVKIKKSLYSNDVLNKPHIYRIELINTLACNARCSFCSNYKLNESHQSIQPETVLRVVEEAVKHGTPSINFLGGEALVDPRFFGYLELFSRAGMHIGLGTNGLLLTKPNLERLKELGVLAFSITVHDAIPEHHDNIVGVPGAMHVIQSALETAREMGFRVGLQTVMSPESIRSGAFERIRAMAAEKGLPLKINPVMPVGKAASEENLLSEAQLTAMKDLAITDPTVTTHCIHAGRMERCPMGRTFVGITPSGDMLPCYFIPISLGNIHETTFTEYLEYAQTFPMFCKDGLPQGYCLVAESPRFFREILRPMYEQEENLPVDLRKNKEWERKIREFVPEVEG